MKNLTINTQSCMIMGIINATVDSFSGDGIYSNDKFDLDREIESMIQNGVDIVDVGGESTRPKKLYSNVVEVSENEELDRVIPVIEEIKKSKNQAKVNFIIDVKTKDGSVFRIKVLALTHRQLNTSRKHSLRLIAKEVIEKNVSQMDLDEFVQAACYGKINSIHSRRNLKRCTIKSYNETHCWIISRTKRF